MSKNNFQDVMPPKKKRSIRDIPIGSTKKRRTSSKKEEVYDLNRSFDAIHASDQSDKSESFSADSDNDSTPPKQTKPNFGQREGGEKRSGRRGKWWLLVATFLIIFGFLLSFVFSGAEVVISPKQENVEFNASLYAKRSDLDQNNTEGVPYQIMVLEGEAGKETSDFTEKQVARKASGEIVIFNDYDSNPQRLVVRTRFESPEGLIYRTPKSVVVPGRTEDENGNMIPGSVQVTVYADVPGDEYNIGKVDFTIPGFKGTDRYSKFYARSKTEMTGGYEGVMKVVDEEKKDIILEELKKKVEESLRDRVYSQIPEGFVLYDDAIYVDFKEGESEDLGDVVKVVEKGVLNAIIFDKKVLSNYVADNILSKGNDESVEIVNIEDLDFKILDKEYIEIENEEGFDFSLEGNAHFAWDFDLEQMKEDLSGQSKKKTTFILSDYKGIENIEVTISPFWKRSFPDNLNKIDVVRSLNSQAE